MFQCAGYTPAQRCPCLAGAGHPADPSSTKDEGFALWIQGQSLLLLLTLSGKGLSVPAGGKSSLKRLCSSKEVTKYPSSIF